MKKIYSDDIYKNLLVNYSKLELDREKETDLIAKYHQGSADTSPSFSSFSRSKLHKIIGYAAMFILIPIISLLVIDSNLSLPSIVTVTFNQEASDLEYINRRDTFETKNKEFIVFQTDSEIIMLHDNTTFSLNNGILSRIKGIDGNLYNLESGTVEINHDNKILTEDFQLVTSFGLIQILGTEFKLTIKDNKLTLVCFEGKLNFIPIDGSENITITKNQLLEIEKSNNELTSVNLSTIPSELVNNRRTTFPEFKRLLLSVDINEDKAETVQEDVFVESPNPEESENSTEELTIEEKAEVVFSNLIWEKELNLEYDSVLFSENYLLLFDKNNKVEWMDLNSGVLVGQYQFDFKPEIKQIYQNVLYLYNSQTLSALDLSSGSYLWQVLAAPIAYTTFSVKEDIIAIPSVDGSLYLLNRGNGELLDTFKADSGLYSKPLFLKEDIIVSTMSKKVISLNRISSEVNWTFETQNRIIGDVPFYIPENDTVIFVDSNNQIYALDSQTGNLSFTFPLDYVVTSTPIILNNSLYLATEKSLLALSLTGELLFEYKTDKPVLELFIAGNNKLGIINGIGIQVMDSQFVFETIKDYSISKTFVSNSTVMIITDNNLQILNIIK